MLATVALALTQATGGRWPDVVASALIGIALMVAAVALAQQNRSLLTGRGVPPQLLERMRGVIADRAGVLDVPELLATVIGPATLAVAGSVVFDDALNVPDVETSTEGGRRRAAVAVARRPLRLPEPGPRAPVAEGRAR